MSLLSRFFKDKVVLVSGGSSGIGKEMSKQLLELGSKVVICSRREQKLKLAFESLGGQSQTLSYITGDVRKVEDCEAIAAHVLKVFGRIDVLINNAGVTAFGRLQDFKGEALSHVIDTNLKGAIHLSRSCLSGLLKTKGSVYFVSSVVGLIGIPEYGVYSVSKMGLRAVAEALRMEHRGSLSVGLCYTSFTENDKDKTIMNAEGDQVQVSRSSNRLERPQERSAKIILKNIASRKFISNPSVEGKLLSALLRIWPRLTYWLMYHGTKKKRPSDH